jgi:hypothetical protein
VSRITRSPRRARTGRPNRSGRHEVATPSGDGTVHEDLHRPGDHDDGAAVDGRDERDGRAVGLVGDGHLTGVGASDTHGAFLSGRDSQRCESGEVGSGAAGAHDARHSMRVDDEVTGEVVPGPVTVTAAHGRVDAGRRDLLDGTGVLHGAFPSVGFTML